MNQNKTVGIIGLGLLGSAMSQRFVQAGFEVIGFDLETEKCAQFAAEGGLPVGSAIAVAQAARRIVLSLPNSNIAQEVITQINLELNNADIIVDTTTGDPEQMSSLAARLQCGGVMYLDATVGGSSQQTREGDVIAIVGGDRVAFETCADLFDSFARESFYVGRSGNGARMKLAVNLVLGLNRAALAEGLGFARSLGLDLPETLKILQAGPAWSRAMDVKGQKMLDTEFEPQARLSQHLKDVKLILTNGEAHNAKLPLSSLHRRLLEELEQAGYGDADNSAIFKAFD